MDLSETEKPQQKEFLCEQLQSLYGALSVISIHKNKICEKQNALQTKKNSTAIQAEWNSF